LTKKIGWLLCGFNNFQDDDTLTCELPQAAAY